MKRSFYEMLEIPRKASQNQIDNAYASMTEKLGTDTNVRGTAEALSQLNMLREGYNLLSNPEKRALYDAKLYATEADITLMFFPKDTKAVEKLGIDTVIFATLACVFTYVVYQKMTREANPIRVEQAQAEKLIADAPKAALPVEPVKVALPADPPAAPGGLKALAKSGEK